MTPGASSELAIFMGVRKGLEPLEESVRIPPSVSLRNPLRRVLCLAGLDRVCPVVASDLVGALAAVTDFCGKI
jgi:hypothetical protein